MAKRVFFSFHYEDVIRANIVKNHWIAKPDREEAGFFDGSLQEKEKAYGIDRVKKLIDSGLENTSNTCVLIGSETYNRKWVKYEIFKSLDKGNHIFGVHINELKEFDLPPKPLGPNPFEYVGVKYNSGTWMPYHLGQNGWERFALIDRISYQFPIWYIFSTHIYKLSDYFFTHRWVSDNGFNNFSTWIK